MNFIKLFNIFKLTCFSACSGDSGGPLTIQRRGGSMQIGVVSFGLALGCERAWPSVFVRVRFEFDFCPLHILISKIPGDIIRCLDSQQPQLVNGRNFITMIMSLFKTINLKHCCKNLSLSSQTFELPVKNIE